MSCPDFAVKILLVGETVLLEVGRVILAHVVLERVAVRVLRRLPFRFLGVCVEVVRQVLAVRVPHLPRR